MRSAVPTNDLITINLDIATAVTTALGALAEIRALRPRVVAEMPQFEVSRFDKLEAYTLAVGHAHALYMAASAAAESLDQISETAVQLHQVLLSDASALAQRNLLDGERFEGAEGRAWLSQPGVRTPRLLTHTRARVPANR